MHGGVGVVDRNAGLREQFRGGRFAHSDRAGQPQHDMHRVIRHIDIQTASNLSPRRKFQQRQQRQTENREMIAFDALEQMHAETFELVCADAGGHRLSCRVEISRYFSRVN